MSPTTENNIARVWALLEEVMDPEVPVISIVDLGVVRTVTENHGEIEVVITPTYSGCPAMDLIRMQIRMTMLEHGFEKYKLTTVLSPAWTTEWMSEKGKEKLKEFGIAPPRRLQEVGRTALFEEEEAIQCPRCNSHHTQVISRFGSTACKALYRCEDCGESFDYFKCH